jgi:integrative and conjugative element protein (TIGR02256 family)
VSLLQSTIAPTGTAWIASTVIATLCQEADRAAPDDTGGVLLGYWSATPAAPVITDSIGPGPHALHEPERFIPDQSFQESEISRLYAESNRKLRYLGDWHTHPGSPGSLSTKDLATMKRIAHFRSARADRPVMLILAGAPPWEPVVWTLNRVPWCKILKRATIECWNIQVFE